MSASSQLNAALNGYRVWTSAKASNDSLAAPSRQANSHAAQGVRQQAQ
jgi:hypothetical protein